MAVAAYCINLDRRPDRWARMEEIARARGIALRRVAAVDASDLGSAAAIARLPGTGPTGAIGAGPRACTLSHAEVWRRILSDGAPWAVVLEDDVVLSADAGAVLAELLERPPPVPLVKLEDGGTVRKGIVIGPELGRAGGRRVLACHQLATDSAAYAISAEGARQALARVGACDVGVDHFLFYPRPRTGAAGLRFALMVPPVARQDRAIGSDIAPDRYRRGDRWQRLRRGLYEAAQAPGLVRALVGGARVVRAPFTDAVATGGDRRKLADGRREEAGPEPGAGEPPGRDRRCRTGPDTVPGPVEETAMADDKKKPQGKDAKSGGTKKK